MFRFSLQATIVASEENSLLRIVVVQLFSICFISLYFVRPLQCRTRVLPPPLRYPSFNVVARARAQVNTRSGCTQMNKKYKLHSHCTTSTKLPSDLYRYTHDWMNRIHTIIAPALKLHTQHIILYILYVFRSSAGGNILTVLTKN